MNKHPQKILLSPRITEKGAYLSEQGAYIFNVASGATKGEIAHAVHTVFKVVPRKIAVVTVPRKRVMSRGANRKGTTAGGKKAYVYLKKGEKIELV